MRNKNSSEHPRKVKIGGIEQKVCMAKIRNFAEIAPNLPFTEYDFYEEYRGAFEKTELGRIIESIKRQSLFRFGKCKIYAYFCEDQRIRQWQEL